MKTSTHDSVAKVRINHALLAAADAHARRRGMTLSELVRHAVRRELEAA